MGKHRRGHVILYFNNIANRSLYKEIKEAEDIVTKVLWNLLTKEDKEDLFHDDIDFFNDWIDRCPKDLLDKYVKHLSKGESIRDSIDKSLNYGDYFDAANISPTDKNILDKLKDLFESNGNKLISKSEDSVDMVDGVDIILYTYHFSIKNI